MEHVNIEKASGLAFALAGEIVTTTEQASRILKHAIRNKKEWLIPQAESVLRQLQKVAA